MFTKKDTIFALASAHGKAGVSVFRISGERAFEIAKTMTKMEKIPEIRKAIYSNIFTKNNEILDSAIIIFFQAPHSFTGEDVVEIHTHGSRAIINATLERLSTFGNEVRLAERGEFSRRAFENNKMDLLEVEGLADLIDATTEAQRQQAVRQLGGGLSTIYDGWREILLNILGNYEANIDFNEDDIPADLQIKTDEKVSILIEKIEHHLNDGARGQILRDGVSVAIIGKPNVGKSSLFNKILKEDKAIISSIAGTTRDVIEADLDIKGYPVSIADTAGIRETLDEIESEGIRRALKRAENANIIISISDDLESFQPAPKDCIEIKILNKIDRFSGEITKIPTDIIKLSTITNEGFENFQTIFEEKILQIAGISESPIITRQRHREALKHAVEFLKTSLEDNFIEIKAENIRLASEEFSKVIGYIDIEEILGKIFSGFCIGK